MCLSTPTFYDIFLHIQLHCSSQVRLISICIHINLAERTYFVVWELYFIFILVFCVTPL